MTHGFGVIFIFNGFGSLDGGLRGQGLQGIHQPPKRNGRRSWPHQHC